MTSKFTVLILLCFFSLFLMADNDLKKFEVSDGEHVYYTGRIAPPADRVEEIPSLKYLIEDASYPKTLNRDFSKLSPIIDQKACGSCVYFAVTRTWADTMILRGMPLVMTAPKYLMDCAARDWGCSGSFFTKVAGGLVSKGGSALEAEYPYRPQQGSCQGSPKLYGKALAMRLIDNSAKSIIAALNDKRAVAVTIGAGGAFMNGGKNGQVFSACSNVGTNHQVSLYDYDCESSVDENGKCVFNAQGNLPPGVGFWYLANSWGLSFGTSGVIKIRMTDSSGRKCNNLTEEAGVIDVGDPLPPPGPVSFDMDSPVMTLKVTLASESKVSVSEAKAVIQPFLDSLK